MIFHVVFFQLQAQVDAPKLEEMVRSTRSQLLKIQEILAVKSGRNVDPSSQWPFFISLEVESLDKLRMAMDEAVYMKFLETIIRPNTSAHFTMDFEMDPSKDLKYS